MKIKFLNTSLLVSSIFALLVWSCNDDFTEEDLLQQQAAISLQTQKDADSLAAAQQNYADSLAAEQQAHDDSVALAQQNHQDSVALAQQNHDDSLALAERDHNDSLALALINLEYDQSITKIQYAVTVYNASVSSANSGGRTTGLTGAEVTVAIGGQSVTIATDPNGMAIFEDVPSGSVAGTVSLEGFTNVHFVANLNNNDANNESLELTAGTIVPIFELSGPNAAVVSGRVTYEGDLLNDTSEIVPDGTRISFNIDVEQPQFVAAYLEREQDANVLGQLSSLAFAIDFIAQTTNGEYSIELPASPGGLNYELSFSDFMADQMIAINSYNNVVNDSMGVRDVVAIPTHFSQSTGAFFNTNDPRAFIPILSATQVDIDPPPPSGSGAEMTALLLPGGIGALSILVPGSGWASGETNIPVTISNEYWDSTVPGAMQAAATATADVEGQIATINVTEAGFGYRGRPMITVGGSGSGAVVESDFSTTIVPLFLGSTMLTSGGSGYFLPPVVEIRGIRDVSEREQSETTTCTIFNGSVVDVVIPATQYIYPPSVNFKSILTIQATMEPDIYGGQINSLNLINEGGGYNPMSAPGVTFRDLRGIGLGAVAHLEVLGNGFINGSSIQIISNGSNYTEGEANFPNIAAPFAISTNLDNGTISISENSISVKAGNMRIVNAYFGTGIRQRGVQ